MLLIDTNICLELFLGQEKADDCEKFLDKISRGDLEAVVTKFILHAAGATLNNPRCTSKRGLEDRVAE